MPARRRSQAVGSNAVDDIVSAINTNISRIETNFNTRLSEQSRLLNEIRTMVPDSNSNMHQSAGPEGDCN